jgi:hypothetical protein
VVIFVHFGIVLKSGVSQCNKITREYLKLEGDNINAKLILREQERPGTGDGTDYSPPFFIFSVHFRDTPRKERKCTNHYQTGAGSCIYYLPAGYAAGNDYLQK